jgi:hypothetical protein
MANAWAGSTPGFNVPIASIFVVGVGAGGFADCA